jgi:hypothetical protein
VAWASMPYARRRLAGWHKRRYETPEVRRRNPGKIGISFADKAIRSAFLALNARVC